ncbi:MAG: LysE family translocator [Halomonas sp.]|nr:LysE family translocator [Halomonas sp.]TVP42749.1 MAG: LysE family translocator [Halomonas sp.]
MSIEVWLAFAAASTALLIIPGPTILTVISYSIAQGRRANIPLVAAVTLGDSTALAFSLLGLGAVLATSAFWFTVIKWIGGLYLLYMGIKLLRAGFASTKGVAPVVSGSRWKLFANTYLVTALNPKGMVFFIAFLPQFINPNADAGTQLWILAATFVGLATLNATLYAVFASSARKLLTSPRAQRRFNVVGGSLLSSAGVWALLAKRPV